LAVSLYLHGAGHFHPENVLDNAFFESLDIGTTSAWILERVGIRTRRTVLPLEYLRTTRNRDPRAAMEAALYNNATTGRIAAMRALARAGLAPSDIGMVLAGGSALDTVTPAEACNVAAALGIEAPALDIISACTTLHTQLYMLSLMDPTKLPRFILIVVPENVTRVIDYSDRAGAVLWGDCTAAYVVSTQERGRAEVLGNSMASSPAGHDKVVVPRQGHFRQEGRTVQSFAIKQTTRLLGELQQRYADPERTLHFVGHQANLGMLENVCRHCEITPQRHHSNVVDFGNTAGAGSASVISMRWDDWGPRDDVAVVGVGGGLTWAGYLLRFGDAP
jgi:3-oxoacyl-[acyl-carrier-protein] synthase III